MTPELSTNLEIIATRFPDMISELKAQLDLQPKTHEFDAYIDTIYGLSGSDELLDRWLQHVPSESNRIVITTGFGDGRHLRKLIESIPQTSRVCVVECQPSLLLYALYQSDYSELLSDARLILITPFSYREIITKLNIEIIGIESASTFVYSPIYNLVPELYKNVLSTVVRQVTTRWNQIKTDVDNAEIVFENSMRNLARIGLGSDIISLQDHFKDKPLILVGAGPSLDDSFEFLRQAQGKAIIAVVNSAYRAVVNQGIRPDVTVAVDPKEGTFRGYEGSDTSEAVLICTYLVYPKVLEKFEDRVFPLSSHNFLMTLLRRVMSLREEPGIVGDGTVSATVVNLASFWGCHEVYLVGQDLAISKSGRTHTQDSFYTDRKENHFDLSGCVWVEGNSGEDVPVEPKLHAYLKIFENQVSFLDGIQFYNLSRNGAKIHGVPFLSVQEGIERMNQFPAYDFHSKMHELVNGLRYPENAMNGILYFFEKYLTYLKGMLKPLMKFSVQGEMCTELHDVVISEIEDSELSIRSSYESIIKLFNENAFFSSILVEGRSKKEYHDFISSGESWSLLTNNQAKLSDLLPHAWALVEGSIFQIEIITRYLFPEKKDV